MLGWDVGQNIVDLAEDEAATGSKNVDRHFVGLSMIDGRQHPLSTCHAPILAQKMGPGLHI